MSDRWSPLAAKANTIVEGRVRFTFLTDRFVRMEWSADAPFEDRPTLAVVNRRMPRVKVRRSRRGRQVTLRTEALTIRYSDDGRRLSKRNLSIEFHLDGKAVTWHPGKRDAKKENLGGTARTLDAVAGDDVDMGEGLISRGGWACVDDSRSPVLHPHERFDFWPAARPPGDRQDLYLLAYGLDYKAALADAAEVFGRPPLPPRFTLGYWYSRAWVYTDTEIAQLIEDCDRLQIGLDVMVIDSNWHLAGWGGTTWDRGLFDDPAGFLGRLKRRGVKVTMNLHPADGVAPAERRYDAMCKALGQDPAVGETIGFDVTDPKYMAAYFDICLRPHERLGVDFWWIDWQQGERSAIAGLDPLTWLNTLHWQDMARRRPARRPLVFSRFGGLGSQRYPLGFSGDTTTGWDSLAFQPRFTATAANVLFGHWSHDIGGHNPGVVEPELYLRWIQLGAHSPILRTHCTRNRRAERRVWKYPSPYGELMIDAIRRRYELVPYIYTANSRVRAGGLSLCRPMYHEHPRRDEAYRCDGQYYFGDDMIVAPVVRPLSATDALAGAEVWLPPGRWYDDAVGQMLDGDAKYSRRYTLSEVPAFVAAGALVWRQPPVTRLEPGSYRELVLAAYPGGRGAGELYEDDGVSTGYRRGESARIVARQTASSSRRTIRIGPAKGTFKGFRKRRLLELRLPGVRPPASVTRNGRKVAWRFDGEAATLVIEAAGIDVTAETRFEVRWDGPADGRPALKGLLARLEQVWRMTRDFQARWTITADRESARLAQTGRRLSRRPQTYDDEVADLAAALPAMAARTRKLECTDDDEARALRRRAVKLIAACRVLIDDWE